MMFRRGSSLHIRAVLFFLILSNISDLANATLSAVFNPSRWAPEVLVIRAMSGLAMAESREISPGWFMPISMMAHSWTGASLSRVRGMPISLFKFPWVARTSNWVAKISLVIFRVVVLPLEPVMATSLTWLRMR